MSVIKGVTLFFAKQLRQEQRHDVIKWLQLSGFYVNDVKGSQSLCWHDTSNQHSDTTIPRHMTLFSDLYMRQGLGKLLNAALIQKSMI